MDEMRQKCEVFMNIGDSLFLKDGITDTENAYSNYAQAWNLYTKMDDKEIHEEKTFCFYKIATCLVKMGYEHRAYDYFVKVIEMIGEPKDDAMLLLKCQTLSACGDIAKKAEHPKLEKLYYQAALEDLDPLIAVHDKTTYPLCAHLYLKLSQYIHTEKYLNTALTYIEKCSMVRYLNDYLAIYQNLSDYYENKAMYEIAFKYAEKKYQIDQPPKKATLKQLVHLAIVLGLKNKEAYYQNILSNLEETNS